MNAAVNPGTADPQATTRIVHKPCAFNPGGVDAKTCKSYTETLRHNLHGCCGSKESGKQPCQSPLRACWACILEGGGGFLDPNKVENKATGLCAWHQEHGKDVKRANKSVAMSISLSLPGSHKKLEPAALDEEAKDVEESQAPLAPKPVPAAASGDVEAVAKRLSSLRGRDRQILRVYVEQGRDQVKAARLLCLTEGSLYSRVSALCTQVGIPSFGRGGFEKRTSILDQAWQMQSGQQENSGQ